MSYLVAINAKDLERKDKDKCLKSRTKYAKGNGETVVSGVVTGVETPVSRVKSVTLKLRLYFHL